MRNVLIWSWLVLMQVPSPSPTGEPDVYPQQGNGFAAAILPALVGVGVLVLAAMWLSSSPRRRRRQATGRDHRPGRGPGH